MTRPLKPATQVHLSLVVSATFRLREARQLLVAAGCEKSAEKVRAALKSAAGALRHVQRRAYVTQQATSTLPVRLSGRRPRREDWLAMDQDAP